MRTHTENHREYIVITLDQFPGAPSKQIIVHFSAQQEGDRELEWREQTENNNDKNTTENIKVLLNERGKEGKQGSEKRKTKENTVFQGKMGEEKEEERDKKPSWQSVWDDKYKQGSQRGLHMKFHDFSMTFHNGVEAHLCNFYGVWSAFSAHDDS